MTIHPTAAVDPDAELGREVIVGPYAVIEAGARIGDRCIIQAHAIVGRHVTMGNGNLVGYGAVLGGDPQDLALHPRTQSEVRIGHDNRIREYCTIHRGTDEGSATTIGDRCFLMTGAHVGHNVEMGNDVILASNVLLGGRVTVQDRVFLGGGSVFHQHVRIGRLAICQGISGFSKDIPPFTMAVGRNLVAGLNVVGLRRAGLGIDQRAGIKRAFDLVYRSGRNVGQALAAAEELSWTAEGREFLDFVAGAKQRGICALTRSGEGDFRNA
jgi:UDP-N-acetylglucosamine acyltransferase